MAFFLPLLIGLVLGCAIGGLTVALLRRRNLPGESGGVEAVLAQAQAQWQQRAEVEKQALVSQFRADEAEHTAALSAQLAAEQATVTGLRAQLASSVQQFHDLQEKVRFDQSQREQQTQTESKVLQALAPVAKSLGDMQQRVVQLEQQRTEQHGELSQQLKSALESEERLRSTAESLASALRSNSTRGVWGETQLRSVVEAAGLIERVDFDTQTTISSDAGSGRPDMVVHLPGGKNIAVDAKVPFTAYLEASSIPVTATGAEADRRKSLLRDHVKALRDHVTALGNRTYWSGLDSSPELVIAFIPSESLISSALETDPGLMEFAFSRRVALASPVTLWSVLKTVAFSWQQDVLTKEAKTLFDLSRELYTRLGRTAEHIEKLGRSIERSVKDYNGFVGSLERQVLPTARKIGALNEEKLFTTLDGIEEPTRALTAPELTTPPDTPNPEPTPQILQEDPPPSTPPAQETIPDPLPQATPTITPEASASPNPQGTIGQLLHRHAHQHPTHQQQFTSTTEANDSTTATQTG